MFVFFLVHFAVFLQFCRRMKNQGKKAVRKNRLKELNRKK